MGQVSTFGPFTYDAARRSLRRDGTRLQPGGRALALLEALLEAKGEVVAKQALMDRAWPGIFVEEANIGVQISQLRRLLGRREDGSDWIVTVPRLGYCLPRDAQSGPSRASKDRPSIVVLPFENPGGDSTADYFADGVVSDITTALTRFGAFTVVSRNVAFAYRDRRTDPRRIAAELGVDYVLEGSLYRDDKRLRVTARLVDGESGAQLWAERFEGPLGQVFEMQDMVTEGVAIAVAPSIGHAELRRSRSERPGSASAYDVCLRALADIADESEPANRRAIAATMAALAAEPDNARLLALAAWALEHRNTMGWPPATDQDVPLCLDLARRALRHANGDAEIMAWCGMALLQAGREYETGLAVTRAAAAINPYAMMVNAAAGTAAMLCGDVAEAEACYNRMLALGPLDPDIRFALTGLAMIRIVQGAHEAALPLAGRSLAVNAHFDATHWMLIAANAHLGRLDVARRHLEALLRLVPNVTVSRIRAGQPARYPERVEPVLEGLRRAGLPE